MRLSVFSCILLCMGLSAFCMAHCRLGPLFMNFLQVLQYQRNKYGETNRIVDIGFREKLIMEKKIQNCRWCSRNMAVACINSLDKLKDI